MKGRSLMVQKTVVTVVCDLPHDGEVEGSETVSFSVDSAAFEIDLCSRHAKELHDIFSGYIEHARRLSGAGRRRKTRSGPGRERSSEIRQWARERGDKVSERGRIPASIIQEYEATH
ncbi:MAG TPA: Lsr2 family protein [Streptosporangiaceae bacterium]